MTAPDPATAGASRVPVVALRGGVARAGEDWLADELPVALVLNGISHAVMMATPADLEDFAHGFCFTEGLAEPGELRAVEAVAVAEGIELRLEVSAACEWRLRERRRTLAGRTGCGLCGTDSLSQVRQPLPLLPARRFEPAALARAQRELRAGQALQRLTGATHAAAWCSRDGAALLVREDVGRHNALDKLVGAMRRGGIAPGEGFVAITSRASFEMVQKTARLGASALAAVSAPTTMAVELALSCNLLLAGFVRGDEFVAYSFAERLGLPPTPV
ncbi:formate dehydrogenase accessory sulfurtransferase FdhD [Rubrivivax gelatinosus]|uniref:Sulfur carrier protein FdhD n=1 Tax=Rubrivivax gelatinosus TaxID=28068 RepID=A0ABS1DTL4_RUBGE|nr:formate dehydrogenase accessory sulfurtransferase FdhD [Rubrivivax gelatinosus]MBK1713367.1 sulfurtransferase FdhD [Rubrivivax gelatinosus]